MSSHTHRQTRPGNHGNEPRVELNGAQMAIVILIQSINYQMEQLLNLNNKIRPHYMEKSY